MDISKLSPGANAPESVNVLIELPMGGGVKYELDKESGFLMVDRFNFTAMSYPFNYGFIPGTKSEDSDPMDVLLLSPEPIYPNTLIVARPIGMLEMEDEAGIDTKILAVPTLKADPHFGSFNDIDDVAEATKKKIKHFFDHYKELEPGKWVKTKNFLDKKAAFEAINKSLNK